MLYLLTDGDEIIHCMQGDRNSEVISRYVVGKSKNTPQKRFQTSTSTEDGKVGESKQRAGQNQAERKRTQVVVKDAHQHTTKE